MNPIRFATKDSRVSHVSRWSWRQPISCSSYSSRWSNSDGQEQRDLGRENPEMDTWWLCWGGVIPETVPKLLSQPLIQSNCLSGIKNCVLATETIFSPRFERNNQDFLKWEKKRKTENFRVSVFLGETSKHQGGSKSATKKQIDRLQTEAWWFVMLLLPPTSAGAPKVPPPDILGGLSRSNLIWLKWIKLGSVLMSSRSEDSLSFFFFFAVISSDLSASF